MNYLGGLSNYYYWICLESNADTVWSQYFSGGCQYNYSRYYVSRVRPVRAF